MAGEEHSGLAGGGVPEGGSGVAVPPVIESARSDPATPGWAWFYLSGGTSVGPLGDAEFRELVARGRVRPETAVWSAGLGAWRRAQTVYELVEALRAGSGARAKAPPTVRGQVVVRPLGVGPVTGMGSATPPGVVVRLLAPVGRSSLAIAAGYLGLLSVLIVFAPFAIVLGVLALRELGRRPELSGRGRAWFGIVMGSAAMLAFALMLGGVLPSPW